MTQTMLSGRELNRNVTHAQRAAQQGPAVIETRPADVPDRRSEHDALIAVTALVYGMAVVTRNVTDFEPTGVRLHDPWTEPVQSS